MKVVLVGYGKMGKEVERVLLEKGYEIVGKIERGGNFGVISEGDFVVEFALPDATISALEKAREYGKKYILGTTGHTQEQLKTIREFGNYIPIVHSSNFSVGIFLLKEAIKSLIPYTKEWDVEIVEIHHKQKKDSPSGTALSIAKLFEGEITKCRTGERKRGEIGVFGIRGGDVFGEHTVYMFSEGERIEISHKLSSRKALANGVVIALEFLKDKDRGYFTFDEILRNFTFQPKKA